MALDDTGYVLAPWARVRSEDFGLLFYDTRSTNLTFVRSGNTLAAPVFGDSDRSLRVLPCPPAARQTLDTALHALLAKELLLQTGGWENGGSLSGQGGGLLTLTTGLRPPTGPLYSARLRAPVNVTWEITSQCNLACRHCLSAELRDDVFRKGGSDLSHDECLALIDEMADMGVFQLNLGGGEPFLREDLLDILRYAHSRGLVTCVSTNGLLLKSELVRALARMDLLYIQVSLDGATAATNDAIRGPGVFNRALRGMELLARSGMRDWSINTVVTRLNFGELPELSALAARLGAKTRLSRFRPAGNAKEVWDEYRLEPEQLIALSSYLGGRTEVLTGDSFFALTGEDRRRLGLNMCGAARMTCSISPTGDVYPCAFLSEPEFRAGDVREERLEAIFLKSPILERFRKLNVEACRTCDRFDLCHGGCPAVAYFANKSLEKPDPECLMAVLGAWPDVD